MKNYENKYLVFELKNETYAIPIKSSVEILRMTEMTEIPKAPDFIKGVINLRGKIIPIVDLRIKFGLPSEPYGAKTCIIIVEIKDDKSHRLMGAIVDSVSEVLTFNDANILPPPELNNKRDIEFLIGAGKIENKVVWLLNLDKILSCDDLIQINKIIKEN